MLTSDAWYAVVEDGVLENNGMISFRERLSRDEITAIRSFVIAKANADWEAEAAAEKKTNPAPNK